MDDTSKTTLKYGDRVTILGDAILVSEPSFSRPDCASTHEDSGDTPLSMYPLSVDLPICGLYMS